MKKPIVLSTLAIFAVVTLSFSSCKKADEIAPVITMNGAANMKAYVDEPFVDPGASASDDVDGDISSQITVNGTVGEGVGTYPIEYTVFDEGSNFASEVRYVTRNYRNDSIAGTYTVVESAGTGGVYNYGATITASTSDDETIIFGSFSAPGYLTVEGTIGINGTTSKLIYVTEYDGGPVQQFNATIAKNGSGAIEITMDYLRPINGTTTNCTAVWTRQ